MKNENAVALGRKGGQVQSEAKKAAAIANGIKARAALAVKRKESKQAA